MDITSNYPAALTLPNGQIVPSKASVSVDAKAWTDMKDHVIVKAWFAEKKLVKGSEPVEEMPPQPVALEGLNDDELRIFLKDHDVATDGRWGRDKLLEAAKKVEIKA